MENAKEGLPSVFSLYTLNVYILTVWLTDCTVQQCTHSIKCDFKTLFHGYCKCEWIKKTRNLVFIQNGSVWWMVQANMPKY